MSRSICVCWHKYTPHGGQFYEPILDFFLQNMKKYEDEYDYIYFLDSTWNIDPTKLQKANIKGEIIRVNPSLRYYDAYKEVLPQVKENLVLFMDNDMVVYKPDQIGRTFRLLQSYLDMDVEPNETKIDNDVVSIIDQIGTYKTDKLKNGNKFCPYWFATRKELLMKYRNVDWSPDSMPYTETFGLLTEAMLNDGIRPYEWEEDKSNILFDGTKDGEKGKDLGYMHVRAGSTPAVLLAWRNNPDHVKTYWEYIEKQPQSEYLRQLFWYQYMGGNPNEIISDVAITKEMWDNYYNKALVYYGLK